MKIIMLGAAGFIGKNLTLQIAKRTQNDITLVDVKREHFSDIVEWGLTNVKIVESQFKEDVDFESLIRG